MRDLIGFAGMCCVVTGAVQDSVLWMGLGLLCLVLSISRKF
jgi:hypothetical protein